MTLEAKDRSQAARIGAYILHAKHDSLEITREARKAAASKRERDARAEIDPDDTLEDEEWARRFRLWQRAYFTRLARKSVEARRLKAEAMKVNRKRKRAAKVGRRG